MDNYVDNELDLLINFGLPLLNYNQSEEHFLMFVFFLDDSKQLPASREDGPPSINAYGGLICHVDALRFLEERIQKTKAKYGFPENEEIKWSPKRKTWVHDFLKGKERETCWSEVLTKAKELPSKTIISVIDSEKMNGNNDDTTIMKNHVEFLTERFQMFLETENSTGIIISDHPCSNQEDETLTNNSYAFHSKGTSFLTLANISLPIITASSTLITQLQIADLIVGITCAMVAGRQTFAAPLFPIIKEMFHCNQHGKIEGCGLKLFPQALTERYNIILEDTFLDPDLQNLLPEEEDDWWPLP